MNPWPTRSRGTRTPPGKAQHGCGLDGAWAPRCAEQGSRCNGHRDRSTSRDNHRRSFHPSQIQHSGKRPYGDNDPEQPRPDRPDRAKAQSAHHEAEQQGAGRPSRWTQGRRRTRCQAVAWQKNFGTQEPTWLAVARTQERPCDRGQALKPAMTLRNQPGNRRGIGWERAGRGGGKLVRH